MAGGNYVNINSRELSDSLDRSSEQKRDTKWWQFAPSPYAMYIANLFYFMPMAINMVLLDAVTYTKLCYIEYDNITLCLNTTFTESHPELQQEASTWGVYITLIQLPFAVLMNLILSSYCDRVGHKLPYFLPSVGSFLCTVYMALLVSPQFFDWPMATILVAPVLGSILGNFSMVLMTSFSYIAVTTPRNKMAVAMAATEGTILLGMLIGSSINGPIIDNTSLATMAYINAVFTLIPPIIVGVFVTNVPRETSDDVTYTWRDIVGISQIMDALRCVFRKREGHSRLILHLSIAAFSTSFVCNSGITANAYLYFVKDQHMSMTEYSIFNGVQMALKGFAGPAILIMVSKCGSPYRGDVMMLSLAAVALGFIVMSINAIPHAIWIGGALSCTITTFIGEIRTLQTKMCKPNELGQMFAYVAIVQYVCGSLATSCFKEIYSATLMVWPAFFLSLLAFILIFGMVLIAVIDRLVTSDKQAAANNAE